MPTTERPTLSDREIIDGLLQILSEAGSEIENLGGTENIVGKRIAWTIERARELTERTVDGE